MYSIFSTASGYRTLSCIFLCICFNCRFAINHSNNFSFISWNYLCFYLWLLVMFSHINNSRLLWNLLLLYTHNWRLFPFMIFWLQFFLAHKDVIWSWAISSTSRSYNHALMLHLRSMVVRHTIGNTIYITHVS